MSKFFASRLFRLSFIVLVLGVLSSCATTGRHDSLLGLPQSARIETIGLKISTKSETMAADSQVPMIEQKLITKLQNNYRVTTPRSQTTDDRYATLNITIDEYNQVSKAARMFLGILAGKDKITATGVFTDRNGKKLGEFRAYTETVEGGLLGPTGIERVAQVLADETEKFMRGVQ